MSTREEIRAERVAIRRAAEEAERAAIVAARREAQLAKREARSLAKEAADAELLRRRILAPVPEIEGLPRVLLIGDSISMGYTLRVRDILDEANIQRIPTNGGGTAIGVEKLASWLASEKPWNVIHFNFGIHDAVQDSPGVPRASLAQYAANLELIVALLQQTGARLIFATTTPAPVGAVFGDSAAYNAVAVPIMQQAGVAIDDLYAAVLPHFEEYAMPNDCHFKPVGYNFLASRVAESIADLMD